MYGSTISHPIVLLPVDESVGPRKPKPMRKSTSLEDVSLVGACTFGPSGDTNFAVGI